MGELTIEINRMKTKVHVPSIDKKSRIRQKYVSLFSYVVIDPITCF
jgi:hypothetical protein